MNRRIFPLNINSIKTGNNGKNYLNWLDSEINSINDYLNYGNPNYRIYGNSLYVVDIISGKEELLEFSVSSSKKDIRDLNGREGIFFPSSEDFTRDEKLKAYTTYFPKMGTHKGLQNNENELVNDLKFYFKLASPIAALYGPSFSDNQAIFNYIENGQKIIGTNLLIPLEFSPSRYFLVEENAYGGKGAIVWSDGGAYGKKTDSGPEIHISNANGQVWSNNYPLMHECYIRKQDTNSFEEFIFDNDFSTEITNIANHSTVLYNINAKNITSSETEFWNDFVYVKII